MVKFAGSRWHKCDLHLHSSASACFADINNAPEDLVLKACEAGLDCIAITDHNTGANIDAVKAAAKDSMAWAP